jgi:hypothetical protein
MKDEPISTLLISHDPIMAGGFLNLDPGEKRKYSWGKNLKN